MQFARVYWVVVIVGGFYSVLGGCLPKKPYNLKYNSCVVRGWFV